MNIDAVFRSRRSNVMATRGMVATSQPLAAQAGLDILKAGGNAADAAIATAAMLNVVEPISTGIGGDCFALYWDAKSKTVTALNGSGRAAAASSIAALRQLGYPKMPTYTGHTVSLPGTVAGWSDLLARHGRMTLADVLQPAIWTAEHGYPVSEIIANGWAQSVDKLLRLPSWQSGDLDNGPEQPSGAHGRVDAHSNVGHHAAGHCRRRQKLHLSRRVCAENQRPCATLWRLDHTNRHGGACKYLG
jgi:gamma-glutamyltranspeptidase / glutathione hydrolase